MNLRMRRTLGVVLAVMMVFTGMPTFYNPTSASAEGPTPTDASYFKFDASSGTINGFAYGKSTVDLVIPSEIDGVTVKRIAYWAFCSSQIPAKLESLVLPETLEEIGPYAFQGNNLKELTIPEGITHIQYKAFADNRITGVVLPDTLKKIDDDIFENNAIPQILLPMGMTKIARIGKNLKDFESGDLIFTKVHDYSGNATNLNTKAIVNPVEVTIKFIDAANDQEIKPAVKVVGKREKDLGKKEGDNVAVFGDGEYLYNYDNPYKDIDELYKNNDLFKAVSDNYYVRDKETSFAATGIPGYIPVENSVTKTFTQNEGEVVLKYNKAEGKFKLTSENENIVTSPAPGELEAGTEVVARINMPEGKSLKELKINGNNVLDVDEQEESFTYRFIIKEDTTIEPVFVDRVPFIFNDATKTIERYKDKTVPNDLVIPEEIRGVPVEHIGDNAFSNKNIKTLSLPKSLKTIGQKAFYKNQKLKQVTIAEGSLLETLENQCFCNTALKEVQLPEGLKLIGEQAFCKTDLKTVDIPASVTEIRERAFAETLIAKMVIPEGVEKIGLKKDGRQGPGILSQNFTDSSRADNIIPIVVDKSGKANRDNTRALLEPAFVRIKYIDNASGQAIKEDTLAVGTEKKKLGGSSWNPSLADGDNHLLNDYAIRPANNRIYENKSLLYGLMDNYFKAGESTQFTTEDLFGYAKTTGDIDITLEKGENVIEYKYDKLPDPTLTVEGDGITTEPGAGVLDYGQKVKVKIIPPSGHKLIAFMVNDQDKLSEMTSNGVSYTIELQITEDTKLLPKYENYANDFEVTWDKEDLKLGDQAKPTVKYRGKEITSQAYDIEFDPDKGWLVDGEFKPVVAGDIPVTIKLKDIPEKSITTNFKVPSIKVTVSMEDEKATVLEPTEVVIDKLVIKKGQDYWNPYAMWKPTPTLAIIEATKKAKIADVTDRHDFNLDYELDRILKIGKDKFSYTAGTGQFYYDVNNGFTQTGIDRLPLKDGDKIRVYYVTDKNKETIPLYFTEDSYEIDQDGSVEFTIMTYKKNGQDPSQLDRTAYEGAKLEIKSEDGNKTISEASSNAEGKISYKFQNPGTYEISAIVEGKQIVRPYAKVTVKEKPMPPVVKDYQRYSYVGEKQKVNPNAELAGEIVWTSQDANIAEVKDGKIIAKSVGQTTVTGKIKHYTYNYKVNVGPGRVGNFSGYQSGRYANMKYNPAQGQDGIIVYRAIKKDGDFDYKYWTEEETKDTDLKTIRCSVGKRGQVTAFIIKPYKILDGKKVIGPSSDKLYFADKIMLDGAKYANLNPFGKTAKMRSYSQSIASIDDSGMVYANGPGKTTLTITKANEVMNYRILVRPKAPNDFAGEKNGKAVCLTFKPAKGQDGVLVYRNGSALVYARGENANTAYPSLQTGNEYSFSVKAYKIIDGELFLSPASQSLYF